MAVKVGTYVESVIGVPVGVALVVGEAVAVRVALAVGEAVAVGVALAVGEAVAVRVALAVGEAVAVRVALGCGAEHCGGRQSRRNRLCDRGGGRDWIGGRERQSGRVTGRKGLGGGEHMGDAYRETEICSGCAARWSQTCALHQTGQQRRKAKTNPITPNASNWRVGKCLIPRRAPCSSLTLLRQIGHHQANLLGPRVNLRSTAKLPAASTVAGCPLMVRLASASVVPATVTASPVTWDLGAGQHQGRWRLVQDHGLRRRQPAELPGDCLNAGVMT